MARSSQMTVGAAPAQTIGAHPLTGKLVAALRRGSGGLSFASSDIERFCKDGTELDPNALLTWVRDLSTLAVTLRNDVMANGAAAQIEHGLIEPLCRILEDHARAFASGTARSNAVEQLVIAERRRLERPVGPSATLPAQTNMVSAYMRSRRTRRSP